MASYPMLAVLNLAFPFFRLDREIYGSGRGKKSLTDPRSDMHYRAPGYRKAAVNILTKRRKLTVTEGMRGIVSW